MTLCFVCGENINEGICISLAETTHTKTAFLTKIFNLMGNDFVIVAREEDELCIRCASLLNKSDQLEMELAEINNNIKQFLNVNYLLSSESESVKVGEDLLELAVDQTISVPYDESSPALKEEIVQSENTNDETGNEEINSLEMTVVESEVESNIKQETNFSLDSMTLDQLDDSVLNYIDYEGELAQLEEDYNTTIEEAVKLMGNNNSNIQTEPNFVEMAKNLVERPKKCKPILPKIVTKDDLLKIAKYCTIETEKPSQMIKIENLNQVTQVVGENDNQLDTINSVAMGYNKLINNPLYACETCGKECITKNRLNMHKTVHVQKVCDVCGRTFNSSYRLKVHQNIHTRQKTFECNICSKTFIHHSTYWYHRKWHDNPYPYSCEYCQKKFKHGSMLAIHRRTHTGEKPYKCSYCPLAFSISTTMKKHEMLHTKEFAFSCEVCMKGFTSRSKYNYHMSRAHKTVAERQKELLAIRQQKAESTNHTNLNVNNFQLAEPYLNVAETKDKVVEAESSMGPFENIKIETINHDGTFLEESTIGDGPMYEIVELSQELVDSMVEIPLGHDVVITEDMIISSDNFTTINQ